MFRDAFGPHVSPSRGTLASLPDGLCATIEVWGYRSQPVLACRFVLTGLLPQAIRSILPAWNVQFYARVSAHSVPCLPRRGVGAAAAFASRYRLAACARFLDRFCLSFFAMSVFALCTLSRAFLFLCSRPPH